MSAGSGPTSHSFVSQRLRLNFLDWGNAGAPPLLLVHGGRDHARSWDWVAEAFRDRWHVIAPDLRGHGDSAWSTDGYYGLLSYVYDLAQLVDQRGLAPVTIIAHSLGGATALTYAGLFPDKVSKLIDIEGSALPPSPWRERLATPLPDRIHDWIARLRASAARPKTRYATVLDAVARMREVNPQLPEERIRHLAIQAVRQNEDGSYSWKFDPYGRHGPPADISVTDQQALWRRITCPVLLCWGRKSWGGDPTDNGIANAFQTATSIGFDGGHWLHHDCFDEFVAAATAFFADEIPAS